MDAPQSVKIVCWIAFAVAALAVSAELSLLILHDPRVMQYLGQSAGFLLLGASALRVLRLDRDAYFIFNVALFIASGILGLVIAALLWFTVFRKHYNLFYSSLAKPKT